MRIHPLFFLVFASLFNLSAEPSSEMNEAAKVLWVPFEGTVELGLSPYILRAVQQAEAENYDFLVLDIDTFGGRVDAAVEIRDALIDSPVTTVAWVNKRAISAGALISLACNKIFFTSGSTMGAATPIQIGGEGAQDAGKKFVSYMRGEMGSTAERNGRSREIAESMVLAQKEIKGLIEKGEVLTLTDKTASENGMSDGTANSKTDVLKLLGAENAVITDFEINWAEKVVRFFTDPTVSGLMMSGAVLGILMELQSPGFGLPGIIGISCLAIYFFVKYLVNLAGLEEFLLLLLGLLLIGVEFLILPGTFIFAIAGFGCVLAALLFSGISPKIPLDFSFPSVSEQVNSLAIGLGVSFLGLLLVLWLIKKNPRFVPMALETELPPGDGHSEIEQQALHSLLDQEGELISDLRPSGKVKIGGVSYQVEAESGFIERGRRVKVSQIDGVRILVRPVG